VPSATVRQNDQQATPFNELLRIRLYHFGEAWILPPVDLCRTANPQKFIETAIGALDMERRIDA
jgi:hypothetical protein